MRIILDVRSDPSQRISANDYCEQVKNANGTERVDLALSVLLEGQHSLPLKNFALQLLNFGSVTLKDGIVPVFGARLWDLLPRLLKPGSPEHGLVQEKLAKVCADAAIREWPEHWPTFAPSLSAVMTNSEFGVLVLTRLVSVLYGNDDDGVPIPYVPSDKKTRLRMAFEESLLVPSLQFLCSVLPSSVNNEALLECFMAFIGWAPFHSENMIAIQRSLLDAKKIEALLVISQAHGTRPELPANICWMFGEEAMQAYHQILTYLTANDDDNEERYELLKGMVEWLSWIGTNCIGKLTSQANKQAFVGLMLALNRLPPLFLRSTLCLFWVALTKNDGNLHFIPCDELLLSIIEMDCLESFRRSPHNPQDFDDAAEFKQAVLATHNRFGECVQHLGSSHEVVQYMCRAIWQPFVSQNTRELVKPVVDSSFLKQWNTVCFFVEALFRGRASREQKKDFVAVILSLPVPQDPLVAQAWISLLKTAMSEMITLGSGEEVPCQDLLLRTFEVLFGFVSGESSKEERARDPYDYINLTARAASAIVRLVEVAKPSLLTPMLPVLVRLTDATLPKARRTDRRVLLEAVLHLSSSQSGMAEVVTLKGIAGAVHGQIDAAVNGLPADAVQPELDEHRSIVQDTLGLMLAVEKQNGQSPSTRDSWEEWVRALIHRLCGPMSLSKKAEDWRETVLVMAWPCLHSLVPIRILLESCLPSYSLKLQAILVKCFLRPLCIGRQFDPVLVSVIRAFCLPVLTTIRNKFTDDDVEVERALGSLRTNVIGLLHDILCIDLKTSAATPDFILEIPTIKAKKHMASTSFVMQLTPSELARRLISQERDGLMQAFLQECASCFEAMANPATLPAIPSACSARITQFLMHYLPMFYTGELLEARYGRSFVNELVLPSILRFLQGSASSLGPEQSTHIIGLLTEIIKWSWLLDIPLPFDSCLLRERFLETQPASAADPIGSCITLKAQRKLVKRILLLNDSTTSQSARLELLQERGASGKSILAKLKNYVETGGTAAPATTLIDEPLTNLFE